MSQKQSLLGFVVALLLLLLVYAMGNNAKKSYFNDKEDLALFQKEAKSLTGLKSKFANVKANERTIKTLTRIAPLSKDFKKASTRILIFENLASSTLANLIRKIENSSLEIKRLVINRQNSSTATLRLEIKK